MELHDLKNARSVTEEALKLSEKNNGKDVEGLSRSLLGRILGKENPMQIERAEEFILKGIEILKGLKIRALYSQGYLFLGELYLNAGKKEKALENLKRAEGMFREMGMDYWLGKTQELLATL